MAQVFEATWFFLPGIPPYAVCDNLAALTAWAHHNVPRQGPRARPLVVDDDSRLWFLEADGTLSAASMRYWRARHGIDAWYQRPHKPHPPGRRKHLPIEVSSLTETEQTYLDWLEQTWQSLD